MSDVGRVIRGYRIETEFTTVGGGMCRWAFASKGGKPYFLKEFLSPKYPVSGAPGSTKTKERRLKACQEFELHQRKMLTAISGATGSGGNLVAPVDFFREGSLYFKVTEKVDVSTLDTLAISRLALEKQLLILKTIVHSVTVLHRLNIVHGDLKPENILIKAKGDVFIAKLIDMDNSYFSDEAPLINDDSDIVGTPNYYSPELGKYVTSRVITGDARLTTQSDVFALGVIFTQYLTGGQPKTPTPYKYAWEAVSNGKAVSLGTRSMPEQIRKLIEPMFVLNPSHRPTCAMLFDQLKRLSGTGEVTPMSTSSGTPSTGSRLKGTMASSTSKERDVETLPSGTSSASRLRGTLVKK